MQGLPYGAGSGQHFTPPPGATSAGTPNPMPAQPVNLGPDSQQQLPYAQRDYQLRLQQHVQNVQQLQASNAAAQSRHHGSVLNPLAHSTTPISSNPMATGPRQLQQSMPRPSNPDHFLRGLAQFMQSRGLPLNTHPVVGGRPIQLMQLYSMVMKHGGSRKVTGLNLWPTIASHMQFLPIQHPSAAQELQEHYQRNLVAYESAYLATQQRQRTMNDQMHNMHQVQRGNGIGMPHQSSPVKQLTSQNHEQSPQQHLHLQQNLAMDPPDPMREVAQMHSAPRQSAINGYVTPQPPVHGGRPQSNAMMQRPNLSRPPEVTPPHLQQKGLLTPSPALAGRKYAHNSREKLQTMHGESQVDLMPKTKPLKSHYLPTSIPLITHGGIEVPTLLELVSHLQAVKPTIPTVQELGAIDINALTMSLRSGLHAEVRLALDTLVALSVEPRFQLNLADCEDLVETLVECAEDQVEMLAENTAEVSDAMLISPYEEVIRGCHSEAKALQDVPEFGTLEYNLDHAVDRLICVTTIIRNLSFFETNHPSLADSIVVRFMSTVVRYLGTRNMLLRTFRNTLDFMKDIVIYLSNLAHAIDLPGKEEALSMIHFLLSFAPCPPPANPSEEEIMFTSYDPTLHQYLPPAVDSLAKLLARDEPNRTFYKAIFAADVSSTPPYDLLSRTFALAVAPIPEHGLERETLISVVEARKPYLAQGLLAAEVLVCLIPGSDTKLARAWLSSQDNFSMSLLRIISIFSVPQRHPQTGRPLESDPQAAGMIKHRGIAVLRKLAEKSRTSDQSSVGLRADLLPRKENLISLLLNANVDRHFIRQLCAYAGLDT